MVKKTFLLFFFIFFTCQFSSAQEKLPDLSVPGFDNVFVSGSNLQQLVPALVDIFVQSLEITKPAMLEIFKYVECHDVWDILDDTKQEELAPQDIPALISALEEFNKALHTASLKTGPFLLVSKDETVKTAARSIEGAYEKLIKDNKFSVYQLRSFMAKYPSLNGSELPAEAFEELHMIGYNIENNIGQFTTSIYHASEWVIEAVKKAYPDKEHKGYPKKARKDIIRRLEIFYEQDADGKYNMTQYEGYHLCNAVVYLYEELSRVEK